jgi:integrase/recombinase XerD
MIKSEIIRTPVREKTTQIAQLLREEHPDYQYLREVFRHLRKEFQITAPRVETLKRSILSIEEIQRFYDTLKNEENPKNKIIINILLYTGVRISELIHIKIADVNFEKCTIYISKEYKGQKRTVPFPSTFKETLKRYTLEIQSNERVYLFETVRKQPYTDRGIRKMISIYSQKAGLKNIVNPNALRTFWLTWLKQQGIGDAMLQPYSGHKKRSSLEVYDPDEPLKIEDVQEQYESVMQQLPIR